MDFKSAPFCAQKGLLSEVCEGEEQSSGEQVFSEETHFKKLEIVT